MKKLNGVKKSGGIWRKSPTKRSKIIRGVCSALKEEYGTPRLGNPRDPTDDLVYVILSNRTLPGMSKKVYLELKKEFYPWSGILNKSKRYVEGILKPSGLSRIRSSQLRESIKKIQRHFGEGGLKALMGKRETEVLDFLTSLPGVSVKVAKCVMMYTLGFKVLPVDVHVFRISKRLGWTARTRADQCHDELEALVPACMRYSYHVDCVAHGRLICRSEKPLCARCCIASYCKYAKR